MELTCTCPADGAVCLGEGYPEDPGACRVCAERDGEQHCLKCLCCSPLAQLEDCLAALRDGEDDIDFTELTDQELTKVAAVACQYSLTHTSSELEEYLGLIQMELDNRELSFIWKSGG